MSAKNKIIMFPGHKPTAGNPDPGNPKQPSPPTFQANPPMQIPLPGGAMELSPDVEKAMHIIMDSQCGEMSFVIVGIRPTDQGADFYMAAHGDPGDLRNAYDHLPGRIAKLYSKKGLL
jgi:hypothetical protein